jgi:hypothetical protein
LSTRVTKRGKKPLSTLEVNSPVDLYWFHRPEPTGKAEPKGNNTIICEEFWDDFLISAKAVYHLNHEADLFDALNFVREKFLGGWTMMEDSDFIKNIDTQIEREYKKEVRAGKWTPQ